MWVKADVEAFDVWEVHLKTFEKGYLTKVSSGQEKVVDDNKHELHKTFCNYLSMGIDGRIGYTFDKYRTKSRFLNLLVYGAIGVKKMFDREMLLEDLISRMEILEDGKEPLVVFDNDNPTFPYKIQHGLESILALNIDSYMGGVQNIWRTQKVGVTNYVSEEPSTPVSSCDGKLEFVGWSS